MILNLKISDFNISGKDIPEEICDKILQYHLLPINDVANKLDIVVYPSQKSGYRSKAWELSKGRSGTSQHVFNGKGAVDWTCEDFASNKDKLLEELIKITDYTRFAIYNTFIHCDYKETASNKRELYTSGSDSKWVFKKFI